MTIDCLIPIFTPSQDLTIMKKRKIVPSFLTSMNLLCGFTAILVNDPVISFYLVLVGIAFDFVDGLSARLLKVPSLFGKELDSLADMVSFGVVPGFLYYHHVLVPAETSEPLYFVKLFVATLIPVCASLRLAKFNVKDGGKIGFAGLPSSAAALAIISVPFIMAQSNHSLVLGFQASIALLFLFPLFFSILMVTNLPMFNFKSFKGGIKSNWVQLVYVLSLICLPLLFSDFFWISIPISILWYVIFSLVTIPFWRK